MSSPPDACNPKIFEILRGKEAKKKEWLNHAQRFIQIYFADRKVRPCAEDVVWDIILKIYDNKRRWNPEKVDINKFMYNAIRSHIAAEAKKERRLISVDEHDGEDYSFNNKIEEVHQISLPEIELEQDTKEKLEIILEQIKGDDECGIIYYYMLDGFKQREIAKELGISESAVNNTIRRIKYKVQKALE